MARLYFDTSSLVKNYHTEAGSEVVRQLLGQDSPDVFISRLAAVEMLSGFAGKVRTGVFSITDYGNLRKKFLSDIRSQAIRPIRVLNAHFQFAGDLIDKHAMSRQLRAMDAIQLSVALHLHRSFPLDHFVCSDQRLIDVALLEGLDVIQPGAKKGTEGIL
ncbi:PIN domain-containing protein [Singulisphaera sp. GP187]|uniref:type II toxin-antitoxin system VapC family toxin n=1 Tax=Singulisphaera sp. GP187 TaxID=1882752 RepID=UPI0009258B16|nr:type II toxin-antitoxin system VapC family toxin [Singulisphaera sp. GP187]SIO06662.1 PIN domain-containing protein [Singulisphaera sp. GP187]